MSKSIGELLLQSGSPLLKMWSIYVAPQKRPFVRHSHTRFEITVINSGCGKYTTENRVYPIKKGDVFVFSSNEVHSITEISSDGLELTNLHFEPRYLGENGFADSKDSFINFCFSHSPEFENRIPAEYAAVIRENHEKIKNEFLKGDIQYPTAIKSHLNLILIELLRNHNYLTPQMHARHDHFPEILKVYDHIGKHLCEDICLNELASIAGLSPNYFSHIFKSLNGISLWDYITAKRIEKAIGILRNEATKLTVLEIAISCGFNNTVNFNKAFKRHTGMTPSQLRKNPKSYSH